MIPKPDRSRQEWTLFLIKLSLSLRLPRRTNLGQCSLASRRQVWCLLSAAIRLLGITRGVSFRVRGQSSPHRAKQRLSAGRARDHPVMEKFLIKLSLALSLRADTANGFKARDPSGQRSPPSHS